MLGQWLTSLSSVFGRSHVNAWKEMYGDGYKLITCLSSSRSHVNTSYVILRPLALCWPGFERMTSCLKGKTSAIYPIELSWQSSTKSKVEKLRYMKWEVMQLVNKSYQIMECCSLPFQNKGGGVRELFKRGGVITFLFWKGRLIWAI